MSESYKEKRDRIRKEQKKRFEERRMTGGLDDANTKPRQSAKKKPTSKLATPPISGKNKRGTKSRLNPSVDYDAKQKEKDKKKVERRGKSPGALGGKNRGKSPGALGGKSAEKKSTEKFSSFGAAFKDARKRLGAGKTFTYKGKKYSTNTKDDLAKKKKVSVTIVKLEAKPKPKPKSKKSEPKVKKPKAKAKVTKKITAGPNVGFGPKGNIFPSNASERKKLMEKYGGTGSAAAKAAAQGKQGNLKK